MTAGLQTVPAEPPTLADLPLPEPCGGQAHYDAVRAEALAYSVARRDNFKRYEAARRDRTHRAEVVDFLPIRLDIENVSRCNFRCTMCVVSDWPKGQRANDLSLAAFKALIDEQTGLLEIKLQGIGEPTLQGDDFYAMIRYARSRKLWVRTTTNASLLHLRDGARKLIDSGVNEVQISIDGPERETFEAIRRGAHFATVVSNCKTINALCRDRGIERTKMWTVVQKANRDRLEDLVDVAAEVGFTSQVFSLDLIGWGSKDWEQRNNAVAVSDDLSVDRLLDLVDRGRRHGVKVRFWRPAEKYRIGDVDRICPWPFERSVVTSDARITPCCTIGNPDALEIPKAASDGLADIWNAPAYRAFRRAHLTGDIPDVCRGCYLAADKGGE